MGKIVVEKPKRALVPIADGVEEIEAVTVIDVLRRAGTEVTVASVGGKLDVIASRRVRLAADCLIEQCADDLFDLIAVPGGMPGAENLASSEQLLSMLKTQREDGRSYAAICAAPAVVFYPNGLLAGHRATAHPAFIDRIDQEMRTGEQVVIDGQCVTSQGPGTALAFALVLVAKLFGKDKALAVAEPMQVGADLLDYLRQLPDQS